MALWRVLDYTRLNADIAEIIFDLGFDWRKERDSLRDIQIITCFKFHSILTLIFCHNVAITRKEIHFHSKDENGIQPFPASGSPSAGFSLSLKCERRQQVAAYFIPTSFRQNKRTHMF